MNETAHGGFRALAAELRRQICAGELSPGGLLPTRQELGRRHGAAAHTIQRAMDVLAAEGFIEARGRAGTLVAARPPHLNRYVLLLPADARARQRPGGLVQALRAAIARLNRATGEQYDSLSITSPEHEADERRLRDDIDAQRLAGVIAITPWAFQVSDLYEHLRQHRVPVVGLQPGDEPLPFPCLQMDNAAWLDLACARLRERGCRTAAWISTGIPTGVVARLRQRRLRCEPWWLHQIHPDKREEATALAQLLLRSQPRPDGLIVADDTLVPEVTAGLRRASRALGRAALPVTVVHANLPTPPACHVPCMQLGYDLNELLSRSREMLAQQRTAPQPATVHPLRPRWLTPRDLRQAEPPTR